MTPRVLRFRKPFVLAALFSLGLSINTQGADRADRHQIATFTISIQAGGKANYSFMLSTASPPTDAQRRLIESFLGAPLTGHHYRASYDYDDESESYADYADATT